MPDDVYQLTIDDNDDWTLILSDQGVAVPAGHAASHASAGSDPITISYTQVTGLGTMATQAASAVTITGGSMSGVTIDSVSNITDAGTMASQDASTVAITGGSITGVTVVGTSGSTDFLGDSVTVTGTSSLGPTTISALTLTAALSVANGGSGATSLTGMLLGNGTSPFTVVTSSTVGQVLRCTGANSFAFGATNLADTDAVTGTLPIANGGTGGATASAARTALDVPAVDSTVRWRSDITDFTGGSANDLDSIDISDTSAYPTGACLAFSVSGDVVIYRITATGASESSPQIIRPDSYGGREWTLVSILESAVAITGGTITGITDLAVADGGTGASTLTGILQGNGASAFTALSSSTVGQVLRCTGANTFAFGAANLADTDAVTGELPVANGGTGASTAAGAQANLGFVTGTDVLNGTTPVVVAVTGATSSSNIVATHRTSGSGTTGILTVEPGTDQISVYSTEGTDTNDFTFFGTL